MEYLGSKMMSDSIRKILKYANTAESIYENEIRAKLAKEKFGKSQNGADLFIYAKELLNNGQTNEVITIIENLFKVNPELLVINQRSRPFHEILAMSYLRKGEQENCQDNHNDESCIIPISIKGQHIKKSGSELAIKKYTALLNVFPDDMQSKWLLNIAYMTLGLHPNEVSKKHLIPIGKKSKDSPLNNIATQLGIDYFGLAGGSIVDDFNNDGFFDIITSSWGSQGKMKYYQNDTKGSFVDKSRESKLAESKGGLHINQTDYNNDGYLDIFILRSAWMPQKNWGVLPNSLLKNNGDGTFSDVTIEAGLYSARPTQTATWNDFNNDGFLDLFIANETTFNSRTKFPCEFYINNGDGTFTDKAAEYGIDLVGYYKGCTSGDINNDGWQDLFLSNLDGDNVLLINQAEQSIFKGFQKSIANIKKPNESFGCWFFDYNNDGFEDLYVASYDRTAFEDQGGQFANELLSKPVKTENSCLYKNNKKGDFENLTTELIQEKGISTMGCNFGDMNNDGFLDFYLATGAPDLRAIVPNRMYINQNGSKFKDETFSLGVGHIQKGHAISFGDLDNDGDQDIYAVMGGAFKGDGFPNAFFENSGNGNHWIKLKLEGSSSNRPAIGARIEINGETKTGDSRSIFKTVGSGASFGANPLTAEIGLGELKSISYIKINWPNGKNEISTYTDFNLDSKYIINEESGVQETNLFPISFVKSKQAISHHSH